MSATNAVANDNQASGQARVGAPLYKDRWSNEKCVRIATMVAKGYSGTAIAAELNDGTTPNQVGSMVEHCKHPVRTAAG